MEALATRTTTVKPLELKPGETRELPNGLGTVTFEDAAPGAKDGDFSGSVLRFGSFDIHHDPTQGWVLLFAVLVLLGLLTSLFVPRRRIWVKAIRRDDGSVRLEYAGLARGDDPALEAAVADLADRHGAQLPATPLDPATDLGWHSESQRALDPEPVLRHGRVRARVHRLLDRPGPALRRGGSRAGRRTTRGRLRKLRHGGRHDDDPDPDQRAHRQRRGNAVRPLGQPARRRLAHRARLGPAPDRRRASRPGRRPGPLGEHVRVRDDGNPPHRDGVPDRADPGSTCASSAPSSPAWCSSCSASPPSTSTSRSPRFRRRCSRHGWSSTSSSPRSEPASSRSASPCPPCSCCSPGGSPSPPTPRRSGCASSPRCPPSATLENLAYRVNIVGFILWTFTLIAGSIWAEQAWGRYWGWDTKEVWTFIIWTIYAGYIHARATRGWRGSRSAWLAIIGFSAVMFNFGIVNIFFKGLHVYSGL